MSFLPCCKKIRILLFFAGSRWVSNLQRLQRLYSPSLGTSYYKQDGTDLSQFMSGNLIYACFFLLKKTTDVAKEDFLSEGMIFHLLPAVKTPLEKPILCWPSLQFAYKPKVKYVLLNPLHPDYKIFISFLKNFQVHFLIFKT